MSFDVVEKFENEIASFFGSPYAVAVDCCTHGIELSLAYTKAKKIFVPKRTYISVPFLSKKMNLEMEWKDESWQDYYYLTDKVIDAAVLWQKNSYIKGTLMSVSFQFRKHLSLGRGGIILTDSEDAFLSLKKMSYDGRIPNVPWREQDIETFGYHYYMTPETAQLGLDKLPKGSRILDVGCGIGGSSRILAKYYGFNVTGITISPAQVKRARELTPSELNCNFLVMDALNLKFDDGSFDAVWSVEAGAHMNDKNKFADEMLRTLRPGGYLAIADWNSRDLRAYPPTFFEKLVLKQLLEQWVHPNFISINEFSNILRVNKNSAGRIISENWNFYTNPSWYDSIIEGIRRPFVILSLGPLAIVKSIREIPTILLMNWSFKKGLMEFGVYKCRG